MRHLARAASLLACVASLACTASPPGKAPAPLSVELRAPADGAFAGETLRLEVAVGGAPDAVEIWLDGRLVVDLGALRHMDWGTGSLPEGAHRLQARIRQGASEVRSPEVGITVDHTAPEVVLRAPLAEAPAGWGGLVVVELSEPVLGALAPGHQLLWDDRGRPLAGSLVASDDGRTLVLQVDDLDTALTDAVNVTLPDLTDRAGNPLPRLDWGFWLPPLAVALTSPAVPAPLPAGDRALLEAAVWGGPAGRVEYAVDGVVVGVAAACAPWRASNDTSALPEGPHAVEARAYRGRLPAASPPGTLLVDHTPPRLVYPSAAGEVPNNARLDRVLLAFSELLRPESIPGGVASVGGCGAVLEVPTIPVETVTLAASGAVECSDVVEVTSALTDLAGNPLENPGARSFRRPRWLRIGPSVSSSSALWPDGAMDAQGREVVAWTDSWLAEDSRVRVARREGARLDLLPDLTAALGYPSTYTAAVAADPLADRLYLVAGVWAGGRLEVQAFAFEAGGWSHLGGPLNVGAASSLNGPPSIAADGSGGAWVAWAEAEVVALTVVSSGTFARRFDGAAWGPPVPLTAPGGSSTYDPRVSVGADGTAAVAWYQWIVTNTPTTIETHPEVFVRQLGPTPAAVVQVSAPGVPAGNQDVVVGVDGAILAAWVEGEEAPAPQVVRVARWTGAAWEPMGPGLEVTAGRSALRARLAFGGGEPVVAWSEYTPGNGPVTLRAAHHAPGGWLPVPGLDAAAAGIDLYGFAAPWAPGAGPAFLSVGGGDFSVQLLVENR